MPASRRARLSFELIADLLMITVPVAAGSAAVTTALMRGWKPAAAKPALDPRIAELQAKVADCDMRIAALHQVVDELRNASKTTTPRRR